jgi:hypothetical protein
VKDVKDEDQRPMADGRCWSGSPERCARTGFVLNIFVKFRP